jgi:hypothetical protein
MKHADRCPSDLLATGAEKLDPVPANARLVQRDSVLAVDDGSFAQQVAVDVVDPPPPRVRPNGNHNFFSHEKNVPRMTRKRCGYPSHTLVFRATCRLEQQKDRSCDDKRQ